MNLKEVKLKEVKLEKVKLKKVVKLVVLILLLNPLKQLLEQKELFISILLILPVLLRIGKKNTVILYLERDLSVLLINQVKNQKIQNSNFPKKIIKMLYHSMKELKSNFPHSVKNVCQMNN